MSLLGTKVNSMASRVKGLVCLWHHEHGRTYRSHDFSGGGRSRVLVSWRSTRDATSRRRVPWLATPCYLLSFPIRRNEFLSFLWKVTLQVLELWNLVVSFAGRRHYLNLSRNVKRARVLAKIEKNKEQKKLYLASLRPRHLSVLCKYSYLSYIPNVKSMKKKKISRIARTLLSCVF